MIKLMKYELIKQRFSKVIMISVLLLLQIAFLIALFLDKDDTVGIITAFAFMFSAGALPYIAFEAIFTFSNDLKSKTSYMLFLTPNNMYQIVGAKLVAATVQVVLAAFISLAVFTLNFFLLITKYESLEEFKVMFQQFMSSFLNIEIDYLSIVAVVCVIITFWLLILSMGFMSITLSTTFLANRKWKGIVSGGVFIVIINIIFRVIAFVMNRIPLEMQEVSTVNFIAALILIVFNVVFFYATSWMLDKKVSV